MRDKTFVQIASLPEREESLKKTVDSLIRQTDYLFVALNNYPSVPSFLKNKTKISYALTDNLKGDGHKIMGVDERDGYVFLCDDDLVYNSGYIDYMREGVDRYNSIVTLHGKTFPPRPVHSYYHGFSKAWHCLSTTTEDVKVDVGGTGVMAFHTRFFKPNIEDVLYPNMLDIWIAKFAYEQGINIMCLKHEKDFLKYTNHDDNIYRRHRIDGEKLQTELINSFGLIKTAV